MRFSRIFAALVVCAGALSLLVGSADARGSRRSSRGRNDRNNREGGRVRLISGERETDQERRQRQQEEKRAREQEQREREQEQKRLQQEKKRAAEQARREAAQQARQRTAAKATSRVKSSGSPTPAAKKDDKSDEEAAKLYEEAEKQFADGQLLPGAKLLRQCIEEYEGTEGAKDAEARLDQLLGMEPYGAMILHGEGEELFAAQRYRRAWNKYHEVLNAWPDSEQAAGAQKRLAEIREGDLLSKTVYTDEELIDARFWLLVGNIHDENRRPGEATSAWRKVVEDFPGCPYAKLAEEKLAATRGS